MKNIQYSPRIMHTFTGYRLVLMYLLFCFATSCQKETAPVPDEPVVPTVTPGMVLLWNEAATLVVQQTPQAPPNPPIPPFIESRFYAMVNLAIHDALNGIDEKYARHASARPVEKDANPDAAVAKAAFDVITSQYGTLNPPAFFTPDEVKTRLQRLFDSCLAAVPEGNAKTNGLAIGAEAAEAILKKRFEDGSTQVNYPVASGTKPGEYRFTPPFDGPPFNGFYDSPGWGKVKPFFLPDIRAFQPFPPPFQLPFVDPFDHYSEIYESAFEEVKLKGCKSCPARNPNETEIALFWMESSALGWNRIAGIQGKRLGMDAWKMARLFAQVNMAVADAYIANLEAKKKHFFWRPITAIHLADTDGLPNTNADLRWEPLVSPTPPVAEYPSAHACAGAAAGEVLSAIANAIEQRFAMESTSLPGKPRFFESIEKAMLENAESRVFIGYHFRFSVDVGVEQGRKIGQWILKSLEPRK